MFKKILLSCLSFLILFQSFAVYSPARAQTQQWYDSNILSWFTKVYDTETSQPQEIFGERYTAAQVQWVIYSLVVIPLNMMFSSEFTACALKAMESGADVWPCMLKPGVAEFFLKLINLIKSFVPGVIIYDGNTSSNLAVGNEAPGLLSLVFADRELSGLTYFKNLTRKIQLIPEVKAQEGFGYGALQVLQPLWSKSRDISYGLLIFAAIIMAFMIMLRTKISPQAVITVQSAVPKLIIAIVLITFSYAIAGLLLDLMYVVIGIAAAVLGSGSPQATGVLYSIMTDGPGGGGIWMMLVIYTFLFPFILFAALGGNSLMGFFFSNALFAIFFMLIFVILGIVILFSFLRIIIMIVKTLVSVYLLTIFAPFYILGGAVTQALSFSNWLKDFAANLAVFPAVGVLMVFSLLFINAAVGVIGLGNFPPPIDGYLQTLFDLLGTPQVAELTGSNGWSPPLLGFGGNNGAIVILIVSLGVILLIPKVADIIKSFMSGRPFAYGSAIGEAVTAGAVGASAIYKGGVGLYEKAGKRFGFGSASRGGGTRTGP